MTTMQYTTPERYEFVRRLFALTLHTLARPQVWGVEHVPAAGAYLLTINHLGLGDPALPYVYFPRQMIVFVADKWRKVLPMRLIVESVGVIWVTRGEADLGAMKQALTALQAGRPVGMAPEGTRSLTHQLQAGKPGAAFLASRAEVPILPAAIWGTEQLGGNLRRLRRTPVFMRIGQPYRLAIPRRASPAELTAATDQIMTRIAALLPPEYRGVYAEHPLLKASPDYVP